MKPGPLRSGFFLDRGAEFALRFLLRASAMSDFYPGIKNPGLSSLCVCVCSRVRVWSVICRSVWFRECAAEFVEYSGADVGVDGFEFARGSRGYFDEVEPDDGSA